MFRVEVFVKKKNLKRYVVFSILLTLMPTFLPGCFDYENHRLEKEIKKLKSATKELREEIEASQNVLDEQDYLKQRLIETKQDLSSFSDFIKRRNHQ